MKNHIFKKIIYIKSQKIGGPKKRQIFFYRKRQCFIDSNFLAVLMCHLHSAILWWRIVELKVGLFGGLFYDASMHTIFLHTVLRWRSGYCSKYKPLFPPLRSSEKLLLMSFDFSPPVEWKWWKRFEKNVFILLHGWAVAAGNFYNTSLF